MKTILVSGLLGAGKTTFIQHFTRNEQGRTVVLVNDFGKAGIDGEILTADGIESIELPSGCVCCTLKHDLINTVRKVMKDSSPELLLIEPSGVASPSGVLEAFEILDIKPVTVVGIVDATEFLELYESHMYGNFFFDQIVNADIILVNKTDLVPHETVEKTVNRIEVINRAAVIFPTVKAAVQETVIAVSQRRRGIRKYDAHFHFETVSLRFPDTIAFQSFEKFFEDISRGSYGDIVRAKALVNTDKGPYRFDSSFGMVDRTSFETAVAEGRLVVIGENIRKDEIMSLVEQTRFLPDT